jgi:hypothetical protein
MEVIAYIVFILVVMPSLLYLCGYLVDKYTRKLPGWIYFPPREKLHQLPRAPATDNS